ncbi:hypothetical protein MKX62_13120 [Sporosarcina sp. FSL K6-5500]
MDFLHFLIKTMKGRKDKVIVTILKFTVPTLKMMYEFRTANDY